MPFASIFTGLPILEVSFVAVASVSCLHGGGAGVPQIFRKDGGEGGCLSKIIKKGPGFRII